MKKTFLTFSDSNIVGYSWRKYFFLEGEPNPVMHLAPQNDQQMTESSVLCLKLAFRLEWRDQNGQEEVAQS